MAMNGNDDELLADKVNNFLSNNRKIILVSVGILVLSIVGLSVYFSFMAKKRADDIASIEKIIFDLNKAKDDIEKDRAEAKKKEEEKKAESTTETSVSDEEISEEKNEESENEENIEKKEEDVEQTDPEILEKEDMAIPKLEELAKNAKGYASYLALYNIADIYFARKEYAKAKEFYIKASEVVPNSYVLGVLLFNTAVCMEELAEKDSDVLTYYEKASKVEDFPLKPRAMFNMARMQEKMEKIEDAIASYKNILEKYPDNDFAFMAKSKIIDLEIKK